MSRQFQNERDEKGRRLVSDLIAEKDDTQERVRRKEKEAVFGEYIVSWRVLWTEAYRIKDSYGRHPAVHELLEFFKEDSDKTPDDVISTKFELALQAVENMNLLTRTIGSVDGRVCQVLVNIKNPRNTEAVTTEEIEDAKANDEENQVNLDKI